MNEFTAADRKFIIKLARQLQTLEADVKSMKSTKQRADKKESKLVSQNEIIDTSYTDTFNVVFSRAVDWTEDEKEFALKSLYQAIRGLCEDTGIVKLELKIGISQDSV